MAKGSIFVVLNLFEPVAGAGDAGHEVRKAFDFRPAPLAAFRQFSRSKRQKCGGKAEFFSFFQSLARMRDRPHRARQADFAEINTIGGQGKTGKRGNERRGNRHIGGRFGNTVAAGNIQIDIMLAELHAAMGLQYGQNHGEAGTVPADHGATRRTQRSGGDQRLHLDKHGPRALDAGKNRSTRRLFVALAEKQFGRIGDFPETAIRHFENADFIGRPEAILDGAQDAMVMSPVAFEIKHGIDHVLDHARTGDLAFLGDVADQHHGRARLFGKPDHRLHTGAHLRHRAGGGIGRIAPQCLDGIDDDEIGSLAFGNRRQNILDIGFRRQQHIGFRSPETLRAQTHLRHRLFARDIDDAMPAPRKGRCGLHQQRRFADARITADQNRRTAHETAAGRPVEFADTGRDTRRLFDFTGKRGERDGPALLGRLARPGADAAHRVFLDDGIPLAAAFAFSRPAGVNRAAVLAHELGLGFGHLVSVFFFYVFSANVLMAVDDAQYAQFVFFYTKIDAAIFVIYGTKTAADPVTGNSGQAQPGRVPDFPLNGQHKLFAGDRIFVLQKFIEMNKIANGLR
ncbi:hypothetical protein AGR7C_Cc160327 [Agrobacterium deltaense Zutra 3/1]|uniref:Uncharacterized protein n=1 Tax=Agrobacterium deltaense Zutra 3/1 TaxID=1183427 RepID=A0A1S7PQW7_9HYPH|nr:hypothetical protein AGR7C_Cc160327 [Agrobacterium deltaense Zutra 3/1]